METIAIVLLVLALVLAIFAIVDSRSRPVAAVSGAVICLALIHILAVA